jgi:hypothetical protein
VTAAVVAAPGPLEATRLADIGALYGRADAKFLRDDVREHLLVAGPAGAALHALALDGERLVGHVAAIPMPARLEGRMLACAKVEALFVDEAYRGRRGSERPLAFDLLDALYELAERSGIELLHAFVRPEVGRVLRFDPVAVGAPTLVAVTGAYAGVAAGVLRTAHRVLRSPGRARAGTLREASAEDVDLAQAPPAPAGAWTVAAGDVWDWCRASPLVRVLELERSRVLVQMPGSPGDAVRVAGWRAHAASAREARRALAACSLLAAELGAPTLRVQPWAGMDAGVARAARSLGLVARGDFTTLYVRARPGVPAASVAATPLLYLAF